MAHLVLIVGLPGSGKTSYVRNLLEQENRFRDYRFFDDPARQADLMESLERHVRSGGDALVTDVYLVDPKVRELAENKFKSWGASQIAWIFFANNPQACLANIARRQDGRTINSRAVLEMAKHYVIPAGSEVIPVYRPIELSKTGRQSEGPGSLGR